MAYAAATSPGVTPVQARNSPPRNFSRIVSRGFVIGIGALATASVVGASLTIAAGWMVAASISARANIQAARPMAWRSAALAGRRDSPLRAAGYLSVAQIPASPMNAPNFNLNVEPARAAIATPRPTGAPALVANGSPDITGSISLVRIIDSVAEPHRDSKSMSIAAVATGIPTIPSKPENADRDAVPLPRTRPQLALSIEPRSALEASPPTLDGADARSSRTAIYDIEAHIVYMPNGDRLEAHSGLGEWMDDPGSVRIKNRGVTPPNTYELTLRESLFHGVQAIRLNPVDEGKMFGRDGILAHSYMLGPNGQSNGCVSFRDYPAFLRAFMRGEVDRIVVVTRLGDKPSIRVARSHSRQDDRYALNSRKPYDFMNEYAAVR
jgi:hypothetical protein